MEPLEALFPILDAVIAGALSAWLLAFATAERSAVATARMVARAERVRIGALAVVCGMLLNVASLSFELAVSKDIGVVLAFLSYPLWIGGTTALASATWRERTAGTPDAREAEA